MNKFKIAMAVMAAILALSMSAVAFAQTPTPPTPPKAATPSPYAQTFWQALATDLGVTVERLQLAVRNALLSTVAKMLSDGKITQQQADSANAFINKLPFANQPFGGFMGGRGFGGMGMRGGFFMGTTAFDAAAKALGMTTQDLMTELRSGKSLADVATEKNVKPDDVKTAIVNAVDAQIDQAVKDGKLTQTQADTIKTQVGKIDLTQKFGRGMFGAPNFNRRMPFGGGRNRTPRPAAPQGSSS